MAYEIDKPKIGTLITFRNEGDSFFDPTPLKHTGFAANGHYYNDGMCDFEKIATWFTKGVGDQFPERGVVVASNTNIAIVNATGELDLWMLFYLSDIYANLNLPMAHAERIVVKDVAWSNGLLVVPFEPGVNEVGVMPLTLTIDFTQAVAVHNNLNVSVQNH